MPDKNSFQANNKFSTEIIFSYLCGNWIFIVRQIALPPPVFSNKIAVINKLLNAYKIWHKYLIDFPKVSRYTLGAQIDRTFLEILEALFIASYVAKGKKFPYLQKANTQFDLLKFLLHVSWEVQSLKTERYIHLSKPLDEVGRMIGGWRKYEDRP